MDLSVRELQRLFFRKVVNNELGRVSVDADMMRLLVAIDENLDMNQVARKAQMDPDTLEETLSKLAQLGLIERVEKKVSMLGPEFIQAVRGNLAVAVGPLADILIEDVLSELELIESEIPTYMAGELIRMLVDQIPRKEKSDAFLRSMRAVFRK